MSACREEHEKHVVLSAANSHFALLEIDAHAASYDFGAIGDGVFQRTDSEL
jgi:hypothetical protein